METPSMPHVSDETHVAAAVAAITQLHPSSRQQHSPSNNSHCSIIMEPSDDLPDNLVNLHEIDGDIVSIQSIPRELILISLVAQEQAIYNPKHEHYRNTQRKDIKWLDIADSVGWSEAQCKAKWKAMRDQYCRELKRSKFNAKANVKWKYFKELDFLRPYALSRNYRPRNSLNTNNNNANNNNNTNNNKNKNRTNNNSSMTMHHNSSVVTTVINAIENDLHESDNKFPNIKIESGQFNADDFVTTTATAASELKNEHRLIASLTNEQLNVLQQQDGSWNYITTTSSTTAAMARNGNVLQIKTSNGANDVVTNNNNNMQIVATTSTAATTTTPTDELYNSFVAQIAQQQSVLQQQQQLEQHQQQQQQHQQQLQQQHQQLQHQQQQQHNGNPDEEDDDPIHTFLNIESYFEKELISMIQQEDILYNNFHPNYRNVKMKLEVWDEIARKLKKTVKQCRLKWKALRDQYIREHKRLKSRENPESLPRWKHYDALYFLQKFIKQKSGDLDKIMSIEIPKAEIDIDMEEPCLQSPKLSPLHMDSELQQQHQQQQQHLQQLHALPSLSGPHSANGSKNSSGAHQVQNATLQQQLQQSLQQHQQQQLLQQVHQIADEHDESFGAVGCGDVSGYDEMDINDYIIGDGGGDDEDDVDGDVCREDVGGVGGGGDGGAGGDLNCNVDDIGDLDDDDDIDRKSQHFVYTPPIESVGNSNDGDDDEMQQHQVEFKTLHDVSLTQEETPNSHSLSQQSVMLQQHFQQHQQQQQQQQQQQHILNHELDDNSQQHRSEHESDFSDPLASALLNDHVTTSGATAAATTTSIAQEALHANVAAAASVVATGSGHASANAAAATTSSSSAACTNNAPDDDEVGAFFKAVAMKIRNAKMSPVAFTDLQIDILRVINGTLRNH